MVGVGLWERHFIEEMPRKRDAQGMTQTDLARTLRERYGLPFHQQTIQRIEAGERPLRLNEAHLIAIVFGVALDVMTGIVVRPVDETRRLRDIAVRLDLELRELAR